MKYFKEYVTKTIPRTTVFRLANGKSNIITNEDAIVKIPLVNTANQLTWVHIKGALSDHVHAALLQRPYALMLQENSG